MAYCDVTRVRVPSHCECGAAAVAILFGGGVASEDGNGATCRTRCRARECSGRSAIRKCCLAGCVVGRGLLSSNAEFVLATLAEMGHPCGSREQPH